MTPESKAKELLSKYSSDTAIRRLTLAGDMGKSFGNTSIKSWTNQVIKRIKKMQKEELK